LHAIPGLRPQWERRSRRLAPLRHALLPIGLIVGVWGTVDALAEQPLGTSVILNLLTAWSFLASGLIARACRPENRIGLWMYTIGMLRFVGMLLRSSQLSWGVTFGIWVSDLWLGVLVLLLLGFPFGRLVTTLDRATVAGMAIVLGPLEWLWLSFLQFPPGVPHNALQIADRPELASAIDWVQRGFLLATLVTLSFTLVRRWVRASAPLRRALFPVLIGAATTSVLAVLYFLDKFAVRSDALEWLSLALISAIPLAFLAGLLRARFARSSIGDLLVELREPAEPGALRDALARALRDPTLQLAFWVPEYEAYVGSDGEPVELPGEGSARIATFVERGGERVAALVHDASLRDEPQLVGAVTSAAGIALENERLQADLRARLSDLRASRARIVEAGDTARRKLERDLHDGAQQRLVSLSILLRLVAGKLPPDASETKLLTTARDELTASLEELRGIAQGIHPAVLSDHGLPVALESLAARAPVQVGLHVALEERLPAQIEVAAYYLVAEGLTNVAKYAEAQSASIDVARENGTLVVEISDDGKGGADPQHGSGLRGLADRVEALDGRLRVWSPASGGTRLRAEIPCA
jgi:signal transduction histidine kinase